MGDDSVFVLIKCDDNEPNVIGVFRKYKKALNKIQKCIDELGLEIEEDSKTDGKEMLSQYGFCSFHFSIYGEGLTFHVAKKKLK